MASNIQIKRSGTTAVPVELLPGELAYSWASGGDKLYIGAKGTDGFGFANEVTVIGGEYFTAKLDHTPGILTANSAIITDATNKIDVINIDNITIDGNTISSTNINGNIIIDPNGTGDIDVSNARIINLATPTANTDAVTKAYVDISISDLNFARNIDFTGDTGSDSLFLATEVLAFIGGTGISTAVANNSITFDLENTGVVANTYGSSTEVPVLTIDAQGRVTVATTASISTDLSIAGDSGTDTISLLDETLAFAGGVGLTSAVTANTVTFNLDNTTVTAGSFGNESTVPTFTVDAQGRLTAAGTASIQIVSSQITSFEEDVEDIVGGLIVGDTPSGITVTYTDISNELKISAEDATTTTKGVASFATADFNVTTGAVELKDTVLKAITTDTGALSITGHAISILGGEGLDVSHSGTTITVAGEDASASNKGIASFNSTNFTVTSGDVAANDITIGTTSLTLGETTTLLQGLTSLDVDNINIDGNTISSTDTDGDIILSPNGTGSVNVGSSKITNLSTPTLNTDAATKEYVDTIASASLHYHDPVRVETTGNLTAVYDNGTNGSGATLTNSSTQAALEIDGVTLVAGDRVLVYLQTNSAHNGVYEVTNTGSVSTNWVLTRAADTDSYQPSSPTALGTGDAFYVKEGNTGSGELYVMTTEGVITFGTTAILFSQISSAQIYSAGAGLSLSGTEFNVNVDDSSIEIIADTLRVKAAGITNAMLAGSIENAKLVNSSITFAAETGTSDPVALGETVTFAAGEGINTTVTNNTITVSGEDASDTNKGIASFVNTDFIVSSGSVSINDQKLFDTIGATVVAGQAITVTYAANTVTVAANTATTTTLGVASFSADNFTVTTGAVSIAAIDGGTF